MDAAQPLPPGAAPSSPLPVRKRRGWIGCAVALTLIFGALAGLIWPVCGALQETKRQVRSSAQLHALAQAFKRYRVNYHGKAPQRLSDLFPYYVDNLDNFGLPPQIALAVRRTTGQSQHDLIDLFTAYRVVTFANGRTILYEDPYVSQRERVVYCIINNYQPGENPDSVNGDQSDQGYTGQRWDQFVRDVSQSFFANPTVTTPNPAPTP